MVYEYIPYVHHGLALGDGLSGVSAVWVRQAGSDVATHRVGDAAGGFCAEDWDIPTQFPGLPGGQLPETAAWGFVCHRCEYYKLLAL